MDSIEHDDVLSDRGMEMRYEAPPNIRDIDHVFPGVGRQCYIRGIFFCYGNIIYNPSRVKIPRELLAHECVHSIQTERVGGPEKWWHEYLNDRGFRFAQELEAHRIEYQDVVAQGYGRKERRRYIMSCAERLSGPLYGRLVTKAKAKELILAKQEA